MQNKFVAGLVVAVLAIGGIWYFTSQKNEDELSVVKVGGLPITQGLPFFLALERGYFQEKGLDVEWVKFESPGHIVDALITDQIAFSHTGGPLSIASIAELKNPGKLKIYEVACGDEFISNDSILIKHDSDIQSISDLKGKKLGHLDGIQWRTMAQHILADNNLEADKDVILVGLATGLQAPALASGDIDALLAIEPVPTIIKERGIGKDLLPTATIAHVSNPFCGGAGIMNLVFYNRYPELANRFLEVMEKAVDEVNSNPENARQYLKGYVALDDNLISKVPVPIFKMSHNLGENDISAIQTFLDVFHIYGVVEAKMDLRKILLTP